MNPYRGMEDDFLMLYRFIECYYKRRGEKTMFLTRCFEEHYPDKHKLSDWQILCYVHEICSLRNHYVHSGYFIKNNALRIRFNKESKDERDYTVKADAEWINERVKLLRSMVIHIIFTGMIGIEKYKYYLGI